MIQFIGTIMALYGILFMTVDQSIFASLFGYAVYILGCYEVFFKPLEPIHVDVGDVI